jgi:SAM-dependent methyltransferase
MSNDLFSEQSAAYAKHRPSYPIALIEYILSFAPKPFIVWDVATGNGQAAVLLADYAEKVYATDSSAPQLGKAIRRENIFYSQSIAEKTSFPDNYFDVITIAQAYHWLHTDAFTEEATRVAKPNAVIAAWGYNLLQSGVEKLDTAIRFFYKEIVGAYWDPERKYVEESYQTISFSFSPLPAANFSIEVNWGIAELAGYFQSWSSVQHFIKARSFNPVQSFLPALQEAWPAQKEKLSFTFPIFMRIGRIVK